MELKEFMDLAKLQKIQDDFSSATGLAAIAVDSHGEYITKGSNFTDFCMKYTRGSKEGCRRCEKCDQEGTGAYYCHAGLMDFSEDIVVEGVKLGAVIGGQVLPEPPEEEKFERLAQELGIEPAEYIRALKKVPVKTEKQIHAAAKLLGSVVNQLVNLEYFKYKNAGRYEGVQKNMKTSVDLTRAIGDSTGKLKSIAGRQKMLALNASIEAARSGEAGVGFAVVAKSMQDLSAQSSVIYNDIEKKVALITDTISGMAEMFEKDGKEKAQQKIEKA